MYFHLALTPLKLVEKKHNRGQLGKAGGLVIPKLPKLIVLYFKKSEKWEIYFLCFLPENVKNSLVLVQKRLT